jgi:hypothetical protein
MHPNTTRRAFLRTGASAVALGPVVAAPGGSGRL